MENNRTNNYTYLCVLAQFLINNNSSDEIGGKKNRSKRALTVMMTTPRVDECTHGMSVVIFVAQTMLSHIFRLD